MNKDKFLEIQKLIITGRTDDAIKSLISLVKDEYFLKELHLIANRNSVLSSEERMGILSSDETRLEKNKINKSLLELLDLIKTDNNENLLLSNRFSSKKILLIALATNLVLIITIFLFLNRVSIYDFFDDNSIKVNTNKKLLSKKNNQDSISTTKIDNKKYSTGLISNEKSESIVKNNNFNNKRQNKINQTKVEFKTIEIENQGFIFSLKPWEFEIDPKGEDVMSEYSPLIVRNGKVPRSPFISNNATIANNFIWIRFQILNENTEEFYIDNVYLKVMDIFPKNKYMMENMWMGIVDEYKYKFVLKNTKKIYTDKSNIIKVEYRKPEHFSININGDNSCENKVFRFTISLGCHSINGDRFLIASDKTYYLAFLKS